MFVAKRKAMGGTINYLLKNTPHFLLTNRNPIFFNCLIYAYIYTICI